MEEVIKQKKDKTELVKKLSLSNAVLAIVAVLFGILGTVSFFENWNLGSFSLLYLFGFGGLAIALAAVTLAIVIGVYLLKFQVNMIKLKNKTAAILNIVFASAIVVVGALALVLGEIVLDKLLLYGLPVVCLIGLALAVIDILMFVFINKNKNPKV